MGKEEIWNIRFEKKKSIRKLNVVIKFYFNVIRRFWTSLFNIRVNKWKSNLRTKFDPAKLLTLKKSIRHFYVFIKQRGINTAADINGPRIHSEFIAKPASVVHMVLDLYFKKMQEWQRLRISSMVSESHWDHAIHIRGFPIWRVWNAISWS